MVQKAGAIIISSTGSGQILLLYRTRKRDWSFPKGSCEPEESCEHAMHREVLEETALRVRIIEALPVFRYRIRCSDIAACSFFLVRSENNASLRPERADDYLRWFSLNRVESRLSHDNLRHYWHTVVPIVRTHAYDR